MSGGDGEGGPCACLRAKSPCQSSKMVKVNGQKVKMVQKVKNGEEVKMVKVKWSKVKLVKR